MDAISGEVLRSKGLFYRNDTQTLSLKDGSIIGQVRNMRGLPQLVQSVSASAVALHTKHISPSVATADLWHLRYGHISGQALEQAVEMHQGIKVDGDINISPCSACAQATGYRQFARLQPGHPQEPYSELYVDIVHPANVVGYEGCQYFTTFTDGATLYRHAIPHESRVMCSS